MFDSIIASVLSSVIYGLIGIGAGGFLFEGGKRYVKVGGGDEFSGKIAALPFFFGTLVFGWFIQHADQYMGPSIESAVRSIPAVTQIGCIIMLVMAGFNYSIPNFRYLDRKSIPVYVIGLLLIGFPYYRSSLPF